MKKLISIFLAIVLCLQQCLWLLPSAQSLLLLVTILQFILQATAVKSITTTALIFLKISQCKKNSIDNNNHLCYYF